MPNKSRRRSLSASRTLDHTVNLVGRIGTRLSGKKNAKEKSFTIADSGHLLHIVEEGKRVHYSDDYRTDSQERNSRTTDFGCQHSSTAAARFDAQSRHFLPPPKTTSDALAAERNNKNSIFKRTGGVVSKMELLGAELKAVKRRSVSSDRFGMIATRGASSPIHFVTSYDEFDDDEENSDNEEEQQREQNHLALIPVTGLGRRSLSSLSNPLYAGIVQNQQIGFSAASQSCPSTPAMARRRYLKEGPVEMTSLSTLQTHQRYLFLFNDFLLVSKRKAENSYKLKEKIALDYVWVSSNHCTNSFLIGWPIRNYIAHFNSEADKSDWFEKVNLSVKRHQRSKGTTVTLAVAIEGRQQLIRRSIQNGESASAIVDELQKELNLPTLDPNLETYQLCFEKCPPAFTTQRRSRSHSVLSASSTTTYAGATRVGPTSNSSSSSSGTSAAFSLGGGVHSGSSNNQNQQPLRGVENVYAIFVDHVNSQPGLKLSESQFAHLDTCPMVNCRLVLRQTSVVHQNTSRTHSALNFVNQIRKVLTRTDASASSKGRLFGCRLQGSMPPQTVLTLIDHLLIYGFDIEGIFRKSPKHETFRILRSQLDQGLVPNFHQFNIHVAASLLKDYMRQIPGQLLISGNYQLWMGVVESAQKPDEQRRICRQLLRLLPPAHTVLLRSLLRLMRKIAANESLTLMNTASLSICLAPCLLQNGNLVDSAKRVPELVAYLVEHAPDLLDSFSEDGPLLDSGSSCNGSRPSTDVDEEEQRCGNLHHSTDSGLSDDVTAAPNAGRRLLMMKGGKKQLDNLLMTTSLICESTSGGDGLMSAAIGGHRDWRDGNSHYRKHHHQSRRSVSPDSALFDLPLSDHSSAAGDKDLLPNSSRRTSTNSNSSGVSGGVQIEDVTQKMVENWHSSRLNNDVCVRRACADPYECCEADRTPVALSREPSDVTAPSNMLHNSKYEWHSENLDTTLIASSKLTSGENSDTMKASHSKPTVNSCEYGIIRPKSQRMMQKGKKESSGEGVRFDASLSPAPRKASVTSLGSRASVASGSNSGGQQRRSVLPSKTEALGGSGYNKCNGGGHSYAEDRVPLVSGREGLQPKQQCVVPRKVLVKETPVVKSPLQRSAPLNGVGELREVNVKATASRFFSSNPVRNSDNNNSPQSAKPIDPSRPSNNKASVRQTENAAFRLPPSPIENTQKTSSQSLQQSTNQNGSTKNLLNRRRPGNLDLSSSSTTSSHRKVVALASKDSVGTPTSCKYRPPKRTAEEILLDKLEVNWSVPDIRKTFQQNSQQIKPIDTLYARLPNNNDVSNSTVR